MGLWNYRTSWALSFMSNTFSRAGHQVAETSRKSDALKGEVGIAPELDAAPKATRPKWRTRLQRELLKIWLALSTLWVGCILAIYQFESPAVQDRGDALMTDVPLPQRAFLAGVIDVLGDRIVVVRAEPGLHRGGRLLQIQVTERKARRMRSRGSTTE
jgi:hypothetical protein